MTFEPGSVLRIPFPFVDSPQSKNRPALVLSAKSFNAEHNHLVMTMITSAKHSRWETDIVILDLEKTGLSKPSVIRFKIFTLDIRLVKDSIGKLHSRDWKKVQMTLDKILERR